MGLKISSINSNNITLKTQNAESNTQTLEGYGKVARFFRAIIERISSIICCCCSMQPLLKVSLKDKTVYLHPDQIKGCYTTLKLPLPASPISQRNLDQYITVDIPQQQNENVIQSQQNTQSTETNEKPKIPSIDSGSVNRPVRATILKSQGEFTVSHEVVEKYLCDNLGTALDKDVIFYLYGFASRIPDFEKEIIAPLNLPKEKPLIAVFWNLHKGNTSKETPKDSIDINDYGHSNWSSMHLLGHADEIPTHIVWNQQQLDKCRTFLEKTQA